MQRRRADSDDNEEYGGRCVLTLQECTEMTNDENQS